MIIIDDPSVIRTPAMAVARRKLEGEIVAREDGKKDKEGGERERFVHRMVSPRSFRAERASEDMRYALTERAPLPQVAQGSAAGYVECERVNFTPRRALEGRVLQATQGCAQGV